jgi:hypothetical protein
MLVRGTRKPTKNMRVPPKLGTAPFAKSIVGHKVAKVKATPMAVN